MTTAHERLFLAPRRSWLVRFLDNLLEPSQRRATKLDPRVLSPHLQQDLGLLDAAARRAQPERPPVGW